MDAVPVAAVVYGPYYILGLWWFSNCGNERTLKTVKRHGMSLPAFVFRLEPSNVDLGFLWCFQMGVT